MTKELKNTFKKDWRNFDEVLYRRVLEAREQEKTLKTFNVGKKTYDAAKKKVEAMKKQGINITMTDVLVTGLIKFTHEP